jgi:hypothetical protein
MDGAGIIEGALRVDGTRPEQLEMRRQGRRRRPAEKALGAEEGECVEGARRHDRHRFHLPWQTRPRQRQEQQHPEHGISEGKAGDLGLEAHAFRAHGFAPLRRGL